MDSSLFTMLVANADYGTKFFLDSNLDNVRNRRINKEALDVSLGKLLGKGINSELFNTVWNLRKEIENRDNWTDINKFLNDAQRHGAKEPQNVKAYIDSVIKSAKPQNICINTKDAVEDLESRKKIQDTLVKIYQELQDGNTIYCTDLRKVLASCLISNNEATMFQGTDQQDPEQFLDYLFTIFDIR
jgi:hypothetical protein